MEENGVRGHMGKALREAVTIARQMGENPHPNDPRQYRRITQILNYEAKEWLVKFCLDL
jgi:hypothetical protein